MDNDTLVQLKEQVRQLRGQQMALQEVLAAVVLAHPNRSDVADLLKQAQGTGRREAAGDLSTRKGYTTTWAVLYEVATRGSQRPQ